MEYKRLMGKLPQKKRINRLTEYERLMGKLPQKKRINGIQKTNIKATAEE